jgi:hypothetical protein
MRNQNGCCLIRSVWQGYLECMLVYSGVMITIQINNTVYVLEMN